jgi:predicted nucleic acid-binding protein
LQTVLLNQINIIGSVGLLLLAKKKNIIQKLKPYVEIIIQSRIYISDEVVQKVLREANEL